jgi:hypothetical protein
MKSQKQLLTVAWAFFAALSHGSPAQCAVMGPVSGYVFDPVTQSIRPIIGVPGAAHLGAAEVSDVDWASTSPDGAVALVRKNGVVFAISGLGSAQQNWIQVPGADANLESIAWNSNSSAAVASSGKFGWVQIVRGPWSAPSADPRIGTSRIGSRLVFALIDSGAQGVIVGVQGTGISGLYRLSQDSTPALLAFLACPGAGTISDSAAELFVTDCAGSLLLRVRNFNGSALLSGIALQITRPSEVVGIAVSKDAGSVFVADKASRSITAHETLTGRAIQQVPLAGTPASLQPLPPDGLFQVTSSDGPRSPLLLLETRAHLRATFVPAGTGDIHEK